MDRQAEFIRLIDIGITIVQSIMSQVQYQMYIDRHKKIIENLENLKDATQKDKLSTSFIYLGVAQMLDHNDPKQLESAILEINKFYCDNYRKML
jgi:hypothetical protein